MHLGQDIVDAAAFEHVADTWTSLDAGARTCRHEHNSARTVAAHDAVRNCLALELDLTLPLERLLGVLGRFLDGRRYFVGLAVAVGHAAALIADNHQGIEAEAAAALY